MSDKTKTAFFPLPRNYVLCCPHCEKYKMKPLTMPNNLKVYKCLGEGECGKVVSELEVKNFIGLRMMEE